MAGAAGKHRTTWHVVEEEEDEEVEEAEEDVDEVKEEE